LTAGVGILGLVLGAGTTIFAAGRSTGADKQQVKEQVEALKERVTAVEQSQKQLTTDVIHGLREVAKSTASIDSKLSGLEPLVRMAERHIQEDRVLKPSDIR
jgi:hypothetical protein